MGIGKEGQGKKEDDDIEIVAHLRIFKINEKILGYL